MLFIKLSILLGVFWGSVIFSFLESVCDNTPFLKCFLKFWFILLLLTPVPVAMVGSFYLLYYLVGAN